MDSEEHPHGEFEELTGSTWCPDVAVSVRMESQGLKVPPPAGLFTSSPVWF